MNRSALRLTLISIVTLSAATLLLLSMKRKNAMPVSAKKGVQVIEKPDEKRVDILIDGRLFTAYSYPNNIAKPVLYPLITTSGKALTRGYPLDPLPGERVDHPHHVGHWFNYGHVNGLDFWNNSEAVPEERRHRYGTIYHKRTVQAKSGEMEGELEVEAQWKAPDSKILLLENTRFTFSEIGATRLITRITTLTAQEEKVSFEDNKEGLIGIRVARALELPSDKPAVFTDANGQPMKDKTVNTGTANGNYLSSEGLEGNDVWGTRAKWVKLYALMDGEPVAVAMIDHPDNPGYPTYWHARDYGLFAANPLGQKVFSDGKEELNFELEAGESATFKYQILIHSGEGLQKEEIDEIAERFGKEE